MPNTQYVPTDDLRNILCADTRFQKCRDQIGEFRYILKTSRGRFDAVVVRSQTYMVIPDKLADVGDVFHNLLECVRIVDILRDAVWAANVFAADEVG
jgi:hypothetical protein